MRLLSEILLISALIYFAWDKPVREWLPWTRTTQPPGVTAASAVNAPPVTSAAATPRPVLRPLVRATATPSGDWMWDPSHRGPLDRRAYDSKQESQAQRSWIDGRGVRHTDTAPPPPTPPPSAPPERYP